MLEHVVCTKRAIPCGQQSHCRALERRRNRAWGQDCLKREAVNGLRGPAAVADLETMEWPTESRCLLSLLVSRNAGSSGIYGIAGGAPLTQQ